MANNNTAGKPRSAAPKKADLILRLEQDIAQKQEDLINQVMDANAGIEDVLDELANLNTNGLASGSSDNGELLEQLKAEFANIRRDIKFLAIQNENIYREVSSKFDALTELISKNKAPVARQGGEITEMSAEVEFDYDLIADKVAERIGTTEVLTNDEPVEQAEQVVPELELDYDVLAEKIAEKISVPQLSAELELDYDAIASKVAELINVPELNAEQLDLDALAEKVAEQLKDASEEPIDIEALASSVAEKIPVPDTSSVELELDYDVLAEKIAERVPQSEGNNAFVAAGLPASSDADIDYSLLAEMVASHIPAQEAISPDYIASKVAEQLVIPEQTLEIDCDLIAEKVVEHMPVKEEEAEPVHEAAPVEVEIDYDLLATKVAEKIYIPENKGAALDYEELADKVAERIPQDEEDELAQTEPEVLPATLELDYDLLAEKVAERIVIPDPADGGVDIDALATKVAEQIVIPEQEAQKVELELDYDDLAAKVAENMPAQSVELELDYDTLADKVAERMPATETAEGAEEGPVDIDYDLIASKIAENMPAQSVELELDYDTLADKVAERLPAADGVAAQSEESEDTLPSELDYDLLASKVADKIVLPEQTAEIDLDYDALATKVAEQIPMPAANIEFDYDALADKVTERMPVPEPAEQEESVPVNVDIDYDLIASKVAEHIYIPSAGGGVVIDYDLIANKVAEQIVIPEQNGEVELELDYDTLATKVAEQIVVPEQSGEVELDYDLMAAKLAEQISIPEQNGVDYDELADKVAERIPAPETVEPASVDIDYDLIASKVAEQLPEQTAEVELDYDLIAAKVAEQIVIPESNSNGGKTFAAAAIPIPVGGGSKIDEDELADKIALKLGSLKPEDFNILVDEEGCASISKDITEKFNYEYLAAAIAEKLPAAQPVAVENVETEPRVGAFIDDERLDNIDKNIEDIKTILENGVPAHNEYASAVLERTVEEPLVTVSDLVDEEEEPAEEVEEVEEDESDGINIDLNFAGVAVNSEEDDEEVSEDGDELSGGTDFANMMKFKRSFIARIIQSSDDQKRYYGEVRNALLGYKKVNSNIAWGAERFHKGRETIARFKIRGKTLVLYLALDPNEFKTSVYHHTDVSENKSLSGTPMMIKIKSPLGVKKAIRLIDEMLAKRNGIKRNVPSRDYAAMYPYETMEELIEDGLVKDMRKK